MDPPNTDVIDDALSMLLSIRALRKSPRGRYEPTFYGRLLGSFALSFDASILVVKFGEIGMLREGIILGVLMDTQPLPINHPFGDDSLVFPIGEFICNSGCLFDDNDVKHLLHLCLFYSFWSMLTTILVEIAAGSFLVGGGRWYSWQTFVLFSFGSVSSR